MKKQLSNVPFIRCFFLIAIISLSSSPPPAAAMDIPFFSTNNILYFDGGSGSGCTTVGTPYTSNNDIPILTGADNAEKIWKYLTGSAGLSPEQTAGIMGNIVQESNFDSSAVESPESAAKHTTRPVGYGIVQWSGTRRTALEEEAIKQNVSVSNLGFQLAWMVQESQGREIDSSVIARADGADFGKVGDNEWETLKKQKTTEDATAFWHAAFERSGDDRNQIQERINDAKAFLEEYKGITPSGGLNTGVGAPCSAAGSGDLAGMTLEYAWPDYKGSGFVEMMPAYRAVVDKGAGFRDMGGQAYRGVDCVGFVTTLIIDSGFDPEFNFAGKYYGKGAASDRGADIERLWLEDSANGWEMIASEGKKIAGGGVLSSSDLLPGDVAVTPRRHQSTDGGSIPGHTFLFVGQINGFNSQYASASMDDRAPMATSGDYESAANELFEWWRKVK